MTAPAPSPAEVRPADGTVVRCTRMTPFGRDVVHGTVRSWHNDAGWIVAGPYGGCVAAPGVEQYLGTAPTDDSEWTISALKVVGADAADRVVTAPNLTSVQSPMLQDVGQLTIRRETDGTLTALEADDLILVSDALLQHGDGVRTEGPLLIFETTPPLTYRVMARHGLDAFLAMKEGDDERT